MRTAYHALALVILLATVSSFSLNEANGVITSAPPFLAANRDRQSEPSAAPLPKLAALFAQRRPLTIIAFGSSSTEGVGASSPAHAYPALLEKDLRQILGSGETVTVENRGIGGQDADDMLARLDRDVLSKKPDLVIWQTGTNDPLRHLPLVRFVDETKEGIRRMRAAGIEIMLMEPQDCRLMRGTPGSAAYRGAVRAIGADMGVPVLRRYDLMKAWLASGRLSEAQLMAPDGLHMADEGYAWLAEEVARELLDDAGFKAALTMPAPSGGFPGLLKPAF